jgi:hypothetical protein
MENNSDGGLRWRERVRKSILLNENMDFVLKKRAKERIRMEKQSPLTIYILFFFIEKMQGRPCPFRTSEMVPQM